VRLRDGGCGGIGTSEVAAYERAERREGSVSEVRSVVSSLGNWDWD
jgi:hypothetical protein